MIENNKKREMSIKVTALGLSTHKAKIMENLEIASHFIQQAAKTGSKVVLLPELYPYGHNHNEKVWNVGEPLEGSTLCWMKELSKRYHIYLGTTIVEVEGTEFYNTFLLTDPEGELVGKVRKQNLGFFESFYINNSKGKHTIETSICRIGVLICNEIRSDSLIDELWSEDPDIILIPFCYCHPPSTNVVQSIAHSFGVPTLACSSSEKRPRRLLDIWSKKIDIMGFSIICDHNGNVLVHANSTSEYKNDLITQSVVLDRNQKKRDPIQWRGQRKDKDNVSIFSRVLTKICLSNFLGKTYYFLSLKRRRKALEIAKRTHMSYHELDSKRHKHKLAKFYLLIIFGSLAVFGLYILGKRQYDRFTGLLPIF